MIHPAFELYAGSWDAIRIACIVGELKELRQGRCSEDFVLFLLPFEPSNILLVGKAIGAITGACLPKMNIERDECQPGLFVDKVIRSWVAGVAQVELERGEELYSAWVREYEREEEVDPEWADQANAPLASKMISVCQTAIERNLDLVMVWLL
jgi:hypothetical protein